MFSAFKLGQQEHLCAPLASLFVSRFSNEKPDVLIPVPSHPKRIWERGYNPALLIARQLGKALGLPVNDRAVARTRHAPHQRLQKKRARTQNLTDAFEVIRLEKGMRVALVDDVVTTGETLRALAKVVSPFAANIEYWAIAESPHLELK
ncbi:MAG: ComF family protein [Gammaproteobacteria bacterium]